MGDGGPGGDDVAAAKGRRRRRRGAAGGATAALACFAAALAGDGRRPWPWLALGVAVGLAQLAKGPVGLAVPALAIAATLAILRRRGRGAAGANTLAAGGRANGAAVPSGRANGAAVPPGCAKDSAVPAGRANDAATPVGRLAGRAALAGLLGVAIFLAWGVPANLATGGELARLGIGKHVVGRALGAMEGHGGGVGRGWRGWPGWLAGLPFYLPVLWIGFAPWVLWLPAAVSATLGGRLGGERGRALLIGWVVPTFALMTLVATRLPHYVLPAWPALALAVGGTIAAERRGELAPRDRLWLRRGAWLLAPLLALMVAALAAPAALALRGGTPNRPPAAGTNLEGTAAVGGGGPGAASSGGSPVAARGAGSAGAASSGGGPAAAGRGGALSSAGGGSDAGSNLAAATGELAVPCLMLAAVLAGAGSWALRDHLAGRYRRSTAVLLGGALAAALAAGVALAPALERLKPAPRLAAAVRAAIAPGVPVATFEFGEPSFIFYLGRWPVPELSDAVAVAAWAANRTPGVLVLPRPAWQRLRGAPWAAGLAEMAGAGGWNVANGSRLELVALRRGGSAGPK